MVFRCFNRLIWIVVLLLIPLSVGAQENRTIIVFAAASLTDVFSELGEQFEQANPGVEVLFNFASSSDLAAQLAEGAPADLFASANPRQMNAAVEAGRIAGEPLIFVQNRLVVAYPADNPASITSLLDLALPGVQLVVAGEGVPVRDYTETMLERMAADPTYGESYVAAFRANIVSEESNVRQVAAKIALGEAEAGVIYQSDITPDIDDQVNFIDVPDDLNTIAQYPVAPTDDTAHPELAAAFIELLLSPDGQSVLAQANFVPVCPTQTDLEETQEPDAASSYQATPEATPEADSCPL